MSRIEQIKNQKLELITNLSFEIGYSKEYIKKFFSQRNNKFYNENKITSFLSIGSENIFSNDKNILLNKKNKDKSILELKKHILIIRNNNLLLQELKNEFR